MNKAVGRQPCQQKPWPEEGSKRPQTLTPGPSVRHTSLTSMSKKYNRFSRMAKPQELEIESFASFWFLIRIMLVTLLPGILILHTRNFHYDHDCHRNHHRQLPRKLFLARGPALKRSRRCGCLWGTGTPGKSTGSSAKRFMTISTNAQLTPRQACSCGLDIKASGVIGLWGGILYCNHNKEHHNSIGE